MKVPAEFAGELGAFPTALRELVQAELESGNTIASIEHGFPAAPCGASIKLTQPVNAQRRRSGKGLSFYERNHPAYAGEFTTKERHFFVLEPPNPPPPEPDMDAIRKAHEPKPDALTQLAQREAGSGLQIGAELLRARFAERSTAPARPPRRALTSTETATSAKRLLHFQDKRPPHEIQFELERNLMTLFVPKMENGHLIMTAKPRVVGAQYDIELRFEAALLLKNYYSLRVESSWAESAATHHDYYRKTSDSWFGFWTRDFMPANPPRAKAGSPARYRKLCDAALIAEAHLDSVAAIQQAILTAMKHGGTFGTSHKEGGTNIFWRTSKFIRSDYGDYPDQKEFTDEAGFLKMLRQFCQWDVARNAGPDKLSEFDAWKLILRRLRK